MVNEFGENKYEIGIANGSYDVHIETVEAYHEQEAVDKAVDNIYEKGYIGLYKTYADLLNECDIGEDPDDYAQSMNYTCAGNNGLYITLVSIKQIN